MTADLHFHFDPVCPFAWLTSKWVRMVAEQRDYQVEWRFISLRLLNAHVDYESHFPTGYEAGHTGGLRLLRVAAAARDAHGADAVGPLYEAYGQRIFEVPRQPSPDTFDELARASLAQAGLPEELATALDDPARDAEVQAETDAALALTGKDVGTPILHLSPPDGLAFFGPVISRLPDPDQAVELWEHVVGLARFAGFTELKRSLRERPQLPAFGLAAGQVGVTEEWHGGSRRQKR